MMNDSYTVPQFSQQFSIRIITIIISVLDNSMHFLYKTLGTCNRISGVNHELPLSIGRTAFDLQPTRGNLSLNR